MNEFVALEILNTHGEMLAQGQTDATQIMCQQYPDLAAYFQIAEGMSEVLRMVPVSAEFITNLQHTLLQSPSVEPDLWDGDTRRTWMIGGVAVGASVTGLAAYAYHRFFHTDAPTAPVATA